MLFRFEASGKLSVISGCQGVHRVRGAICAALKLPPERVRVSTPDVGGGFGGRSSVNPEQVLIAWATLTLKHPVKWTSDRAEACLSDFQTRDALTRGKLAFDQDGRILAYDFEMICNLGAHGISLTNLHNAWRVATSVYDIPRDRKSTRLNSSHTDISRMPSSA